MIKILLILFAFYSINFAQSTNKIIVETIAKDNLEELIKNRNGKILLLNIWATWCIPCREEFPDLVKLSQEYKEQIDIVAISVDYKDEIDSKVIPFLHKNSVKFSVFISGFSKDEELINFVDSNWNGALPASFIYNSDGEQIQFLEGKQSIESFSSSIKKLLL